MLIGNIFEFNNLQLLQASAWFGLLLFTPMFIWAGVQDYKNSEVIELTCIGIGLLLLVHSLLFSNSPLAVILVVVCAFFTFGPVEFSIFGQADFLMLAHFITAFTFTPTGMMSMVGMGVLWLLCLCAHLIVFRDADGKRWRPFKGVMIPALPSYAAAVSLSSVLRVLFIEKLFFLGY